MIKLRPIMQSDSALLLRWRNDPDTRASSIDQKIVLLDHHQRWLARKIVDPHCLMYIGEFDGRPVGQIRFDIDSAASAEVDISIAQENRGLGYGAQLLAQAGASIVANILVAHVRPNNLASIKLFTQSNFDQRRNIVKYGVDLIQFTKVISSTV
jgi:RimJ/RimL family protein N-acetyltransferase